MYRTCTGLIVLLLCGQIISEQSEEDKLKRLHRFPRIIGGNAAGRGEYPWAVSIQAKRYGGLRGLLRRNEQHFCGAALIEADWVVTSAHCLYSETGKDELLSYLDPKMWHVRLASEKLKPNILERIKGLFARAYNKMFGYVKQQSYYHVQKIFHHPKYSPGYLEYDIALLQLKETPVLSRMPKLQKISLPGPQVGQEWPAAGQTCTAVGWGCSFADGPPTLKVRSAELPILNPETCKRMYSAHINLTVEHEFCAGYHEAGIGICPGDSGGPLICSDPNGSLKLAGIVSATHGKKPADYPAIFTRISYFVPWIRTVIEANPTKYSKNLFSFIRARD